MTLHESKITSYGILNIHTNVGELHIPVVHINEPLVVGEHYDITKTIGGEKWFPYKRPVSVLAVYSQPLRATEFKSSTNRIKGEIISNNQYSYTITYTEGSEDHEVNETYAITSGKILIPSYTLIIGSNGVPCVPNPLIFEPSTFSSWDTESYKAPSSYGFGSITRNDYEGSATLVPSEYLIAIAYALLTDSDYTPPDPYKQGGTSGSSGGNGTFGGGSSIFGGNTDPVDIPDLPTLSAVDTGFITLFNPTLSQLNNLASYMWSDAFSLDTFKKLYADPMDCILGLSIVPVQPTSGGTDTVKIGNISTDVSMNKTSSQYVSVDCGTVEVKEYWGGYLDYSPYTKCEIYLPYVGVHEISVDDIMNKSVHIVYHVDILSGACNAYVKCGDSVLYTFIGQCSSSIPISGNDWTNTINGVLSIAGNIGSLVASGGASAPTELPAMAQNAINALKPNVEKSGAMSGTGGMLGIQKPYIILTRPNQALPENQNKYTGYPSFITMNLGVCSGYTEIETIRLENMTCTDEELTEIETLLKQGVVF